MRGKRWIGDTALLAALVLAALATAHAIAAKADRRARAAAERVLFARAVAGGPALGPLRIRLQPHGDVLCARYVARAARGGRCITFAPRAAIVVSERADPEARRRG